MYCFSSRKDYKSVIKNRLLPNSLMPDLWYTNICQLFYYIV